MVVRFARFRDVPHIVKLVERMTEGFKSSSIVWAFDSESAYKRLNHAVSARDNALFYSGSGFLLGVLYPLSFNLSTIVASELGFYDEAGNGAALLDAFENWGKHEGAHMLDLATMAGSRDKAVGRIYCHRGFVLSEIHYVKSLRSHK